MQDIIYSQRLSDLFKEYVKSYKNYDVNEIFLAAGVLGMIGINNCGDNLGLTHWGRGNPPPFLYIAGEYI